MHIKTVLLTSTTFLKITAVFLAFFLWSMLSDLYVMSVTYTVPLTFSSTPNFAIKDKPEQIDVTLRGLRKNLRAIDKKRLLVEVDAKKLVQGLNRIEITPSMLGLPNVISVVDYNPINLTLTAETHRVETRGVSGLEETSSDHRVSEPVESKQA